ncbi:glycosyltransferase family 4 protein [bacterium]|nr:glycosyltransferase family 4 protein [bacterium]
MRTVALVIPWYGQGTGGAELAAQELAEHCCRRGYRVEVLTTCCRSPYDDWSSNALAAGREILNGVAVHRFPVAPRDADAYHAVNYKFIHHLPVSREECTRYMENNINSHELMAFISREQERYWFVFTPFPFGTSYWGHTIAPRVSFLMPHLHDEPLAHTENIREMFHRVRGVLFNTPVDQALAERLFGLPRERGGVMGGGVETEGWAMAERWRARHRLGDPFVLYVGKKQAAKNVDMLVEYFVEYKRRYGGPLKLVLLGPEGMALSEAARRYVLDIGATSKEERDDAYAASSVFCQPSCNESFSRVLMEAWLAGKPALVHEGCEVTSWHCRQSNGGLYFHDARMFAACLEYYLQHPREAEMIGAQGREYVLRNYHYDGLWRVSGLFRVAGE